MADHFGGLATLQSNARYDEDFKGVIDESVETGHKLIKFANDLDPVYISAEEVAVAISKLNKMKAVDLDGLTAEHILHGREILIQYLTDLFNSVLGYSVILSAFKERLVIPIPKKGKMPNSLTTTVV